MSRRYSRARVQIAMMALVGLCAASQASAEIPGVNGTSFTLTAKADRITTPDGGSIYIWGFSTPDSNAGRTQYPGPTLIIPKGSSVSITVVNQLPAQFNQRVSLAFPGQSGVQAVCTAAVAPDAAAAVAAAAASDAAAAAAAAAAADQAALDAAALADAAAAALAADPTNQALIDAKAAADAAAAAAQAIADATDASALAAAAAAAAADAAAAAAAADAAKVGCVQGPITLEASTGYSVTYMFTASRPGTFLYNSASRPDLQVEMGLAGAMIVRPSTAGQAYDDSTPSSTAGNPAGSQYEQEYLLFLSEMDSEIHDLVEQQGVQAVDDSGRLGHYFPNYWFINGRNAPDTMAEAGVPRLPTQPYDALVRTHPGDRVLMRVVGGGHDMHPFHHHGQHARIIAVDAFPLETAPGAQFDLSHEVFTIPSLPGQTVDAILRWTGKGLGWDIYGHTAGDGSSCTAAGPEGLDAMTHEYCDDHLKPLPVTLPEALALTNGPFYSGSPFLGQVGLMPPGDGGLNPNAGYSYMWHSHNEKEITNYDIFPGGMMTMLIVEPPGTVIPGTFVH